MNKIVPAENIIKRPTILTIRSPVEITIKRCDCYQGEDVLATILLFILGGASTIFMAVFFYVRYA